MAHTPQPIPNFILDALIAYELLPAFRALTPEQQGTHIGWIMQAKHEQARLRRLAQMLTEVEREMASHVLAS